MRYSFVAVACYVSAGVQENVVALQNVKIQKLNKGKKNKTTCGCKHLLNL